MHYLLLLFESAPTSRLTDTLRNESSAVQRPIKEGSGIEWTAVGDKSVCIIWVLIYTTAILGNDLHSLKTRTVQGS